MTGRTAAAGERGAALIETALIVPVVFLILFGLVDGGLLFKDYLTVSHASREGARAVVEQELDAYADWEMLQVVAFKDCRLTTLPA